MEFLIKRSVSSLKRLETIIDTSMENLAGGCNIVTTKRQGRPVTNKGPCFAIHHIAKIKETAKDSLQLTAGRLNELWTNFHRKGEWIVGFRKA